MTGTAKSVVACLALLALSGCAAPALHTYLLATPPTTSAAAGVETLPSSVIELRPVLLPGHLDSSEILRRAGPELVASRNGRWGERLSAGIRLALAADLGRLLPQDAIATASPVLQDFRRVSVTVTGFDLDARGTLTLDADWLIETTRPPAPLARRRAHFVALDVPAGDAAQVAAMSRLVGQLATAIAHEL